MARRSRGRPKHPDVLTPGEWRTLDFIRHGLTNRHIARLRGVSVDAVRYHAANLRGKLGLRDRASLRQWRGVPATSPITTKETTKMAGSIDLKLGPVGQIGRVVTDVPRAEAWFRDVLGLKHLYTFGDLSFFDLDGTRLFLTKPENGPYTPPSVIYLRVDDINVAFDELKSRGVEFMGAPHMIFKHENGVEEWMAFFKDPDDQYLAIMSQVGG